MEYQVPQFIEVEDKIVGPLTLRQFIYLAGGAGFCALAFYFLPLIIAVLAAVPLTAFALALAFYKVNGKPFIEVVENALGFYSSSKLFLWKRETAAPASAEAAVPAPPPIRGARLTSGKLHELAWSLDIKSAKGGSASGGK